MASSSESWTRAQDQRFESALAIYDRDTPDRWEKVAAMVGEGKTAADVKRHYDVLVEDVNLIESSRVPLPNYKTPASDSNEATTTKGAE